MKRLLLFLDDEEHKKLKEIKDKGKYKCWEDFVLKKAGLKGRTND